MKEKINTYIKNNQERFVEELMGFLKIPSVSADSLYKSDVLKAAEFLKFQMENAGADTVEIIETIGHPIVYAEKMVDSLLPTVLIYGHYDVQPADPVELWESPPFEPQIRNGKIYARGACDDKGQMYMHVKVLEILNHYKNFPCNIKFLFEGEEEIGSVSLPKFILENKEKLAADVCLISDTELIANDTPSIIYGLKGVCYFDVLVKGPGRDLHSGMYGGAIANPLNILCEIIGKLKDHNNKILIPGFYNDLDLPSEKEKTFISELSFDGDNFKNNLGITAEHGEAGFSTPERIGFRPTLDVNGMCGGYTGEGAKTVIPSFAKAKISMRLVPGQKADKIAASFVKYVKAIAPKSVTVEIQTLTKCDPVIMPLESNAFNAASSAMNETFGKSPVPVRIGGTIPVVSLFEKYLGIKSVLMGFGLDSDNIHSPNESFGVFNYLKGIETIPLFLENFSKIEQKQSLKLNYEIL